MAKEQRAAEILVWLIGWLTERAPDVCDGRDDLETVDYLRQKIINSFGVVQLILEIEERFGVRMAGPQFEDPRFFTLRGLAEIIAEMTGE